MLKVESEPQPKSMLPTPDPSNADDRSRESSLPRVEVAEAQDSTEVDEPYGQHTDFCLCS